MFVPIRSIKVSNIPVCKDGGYHLDQPGYKFNVNNGERKEKRETETGCIVIMTSQNFRAASW